MAMGARGSKVRVGVGCNRVLVAVDGSRWSDRAVERAGRLALAQGAAIRLIHVLPRGLAGLDARFRELGRHHLERAEARLRRVLAERSRADVRLSADLVRGPAAEAIVRAAGEGADLIVVGRRGGGLTRALLGSTTRRVVRLARVPVLAVGQAAKLPYRRIVVGLEASAASLGALRVAMALADRSRSGFVIVNAIEDPFAGLPVSLLPGTATERSALRAERLRDRTRRLRSVVGRVVDRPEAWRLVVRAADPRQAILQAAAEGRGADLIALGRTGRGRLPAFLIGSVAEAVLDRARIDVLVVPPA